MPTTPILPRHTGGIRHRPDPDLAHLLLWIAIAVIAAAVAGIAFGLFGFGAEESAAVTGLR